MLLKTKEKLLLNVRAIGCPKCKVEKGVACRNKRGQFKTKPHIKRLRAYYKVDKWMKEKHLAYVLSDIIQRVKTLEHSSFVEEEYLIK